jgi:hypothetical protein
MEFCTSCGQRRTGAAFCINCGGSLADPAATGATPVDPAEPAAWAPVPGRRPRFPALVVVGVIALLAAGGLGWWLRPHPTVTPVAAAPPSATPADATPLPPDTPPPYSAPTPYTPPPYSPPAVEAPGVATPAPTYPAPVAAPADPLAGTPYWSVITISVSDADGGRPAAEARAAALRDHGFTDAFVAFSSAVPSLNAGYWVAATGKYAHRDDAAATGRRVVDAGFTDAYPRCFGASATACGS